MEAPIVVPIPAGDAGRSWVFLGNFQNTSELQFSAQMCMFTGAGKHKLSNMGYDMGFVQYPKSTIVMNISKVSRSGLRRSKIILEKSRGQDTMKTKNENTKRQRNRSRSRSRGRKTAGEQQIKEKTNTMNAEKLQYK